MMSEDNIHQAAAGHSSFCWTKLLVCSCCGQRVIGYAKLLPAGPTRMLTRRELAVIGIEVCLN